MPVKILSISYDSNLLSIRQGLLEREGYEVISAAGFVQALKRCQEGTYDLAVMGHSMPQADKQALFDAITRNCPVPVISLTRSGEPDLPNAFASVDPFQPEQFLRVVRAVLQQKKNSAEA